MCVLYMRGCISCRKPFEVWPGLGLFFLFPCCRCLCVSCFPFPLSAAYITVAPHTHTHTHTHRTAEKTLGRCLESVACTLIHVCVCARARLLEPAFVCRSTSFSKERFVQDSSESRCSAVEFAHCNAEVRRRGACLRMRRDYGALK